MVSKKVWEPCSDFSFQIPFVAFCAELGTQLSPPSIGHAYLFARTHTDTATILDPRHSGRQSNNQSACFAYYALACALRCASLGPIVRSLSQR